MPKGKNKPVVFLSTVLVAVFAMGIGRSFAQTIITFGPSETKIEGSIKYSVLGRYTAHFNSFKGRITLDEKSQRIRSVYLEIDARSITSDSPFYDKIARSRRLLYTRRFPMIIFKSDKIIKDEEGLKVKGVLEMHGIKERMIFPFKVKMITHPMTKRRLLDIEGSWNINRKDFNIVWNRYLDRGGILVGDYFTVNWGITVLERF